MTIRTFFPAVSRRFARAALLTFLCAAFAPLAGAAAISLNFASGINNPAPAPTYAMAPGETAGVISLSNWNNLIGASSTLSNLLNDSGLSTTATVTWASNGTWETLFAATPGNFKMMKSHLDARASGFPAPLDASVTVSSIPFEIAALYDVYVYFDAVTQDGTVLSNYTIGSQAFYISDTTTFSGSFVQATGTTAATRTAGANYALFSGLTGDSFTMVADSENFRAEVSGIQIVAVPEPGSALLVAGGLAAMAVSRRRRERV